MRAGLNIYAREPAAFNEASRRTGTRFARFAGAAVANMNAYQSARELATNLEAALPSRATIDQAQGILIERHKLTADRAFEVLVHASMASNRKLRDVADHLVSTGELIVPPRRK
jgi:AmiR/NasT family two-component response regulator